jgi:hypothetical protein
VHALLQSLPRVLNHRAAKSTGVIQNRVVGQHCHDANLAVVGHVGADDVDGGKSDLRRKWRCKLREQSSLVN